MDDTEQQPLIVHFGFTAQAEKYYHTYHIRNIRIFFGKENHCAQSKQQKKYQTNSLKSFTFC